MAIRIGHMEITFAPRGILRTVWMKAFFHEVRPETVNIRNVKNQPPPPDTSIAVFEVQHRIPAFCAERGEICAFAAVDDLQSQNIFVEANGCPHVRNPKGNRRNLLNHRCASKGMAARPAVVLKQRELLFPTGLNSRQRSPATAHKEARSRVKGGGFAHYRRRLSEVYSDYCNPSQLQASPE